MVEEVARAAAVSHKLAGAEVLECFGTGKIVPGETRKLIASELEAVLCPVVAVGLARLPVGVRDSRPVSPCPCALLGAVVEADPKREAAAARKHDRHSITLLRRVDGGERAPICDALDLRLFPGSRNVEMLKALGLAACSHHARTPADRRGAFGHGQRLRAAAHAHVLSVYAIVIAPGVVAAFAEGGFAATARHVVQPNGDGPSSEPLDRRPRGAPRLAARHLCVAGAERVIAHRAPRVVVVDLHPAAARG
mmetsp:Transcript_35969/g.85515  ORF Transcript_35969/g.85515 Transcript_35969/m.85515 type:complete len:251 (+) Transcript_35969:670-1422(+)